MDTQGGREHKLELFKLTIHEARDLLRKREISVKELTKSVLERIRNNEDRIRSFITIDKKDALKKADEIDKLFKSGSDLPDLAGIPYALKDNICTKGMRTTCASKMMNGFIPDHDAAVVNRLKKSHAILVGKLNMDEFAIGSAGESSIFPYTRNPWSEDRVPGGSSGGSAAAVAADEVLFSLGTDTGGSVRQPASFCGVVGMKPSFGAVSGYGLIPMATSLDQIGTLSKDITDCAIIMNAITGYDPRDKASARVSHPDYTEYLQDNAAGIRIGFPRNQMAGKLRKDIYEAIEEAAKMYEKMGAIVEEVDLPHMEYSVPAYLFISAAEASFNMALNAQSCMGYEKKDMPGLEDLVTKKGLRNLGAAVRKRIILGNFALYDEYYKKYYLKSLKVRTLIKQDFDKAFEKCDLVLCPANGTTAFPFGKMDDSTFSVYEYDTYTIPANLAGLPALSMPCGFDSDGLPIGMQLIGKLFGEGIMLRAAYTYEQNTDHHLKSPLLDL